MTPEQHQQNTPAKTWKGAQYNSMTSIEYLGGRQTLHDMVAEKGFKLL